MANPLLPAIIAATVAGILLHGGAIFAEWELPIYRR